METARPTTPILELAWRRVAQLDLVSTRRASANMRVQRWILMLAVLTTLFAIMTQQFDMAGLGNSLPLLSYIVRAIFVAMPFLAAGLVAFSSRFFGNGDWLITRAAAEEITKEVYLYRTILQSNRDRRGYLEKRLAEIQRQLYRALSGVYSFEEYSGRVPHRYWPVQGALFIPGVLSMIWPNCVFRDLEPCESSPAPVAQIDAAIAAGKPVILQLDWNKQVGIQTHFVLVKEKKGNDYVLYDPYRYSGDGPDREVLLTSRYKYNGAGLETEISAVLWFDVLDLQAPEPPPKQHLSLPEERFSVYTTHSDLALRAEPSAEAYVWKRLSRASELICLEPASVAKIKVGVNGQWLNVQDPAGDQGFVAAWYVSDGTPVSSLPAGALMFVPTEELSFRSQPVITPETLIRRIAVTETLASLEPANQAIPKVGMTGQWLKMRDLAGREGYVAAWYVRYASKPGSSVTSTSATSDSVTDGLRVIATAEGVALRMQPVVSEATLLKRLPLGTPLTVTEPEAERKIGKNDQWLKVKDPSGAEGFVAAWFVTR